MLNALLRLESGIVFSQKGNTHTYPQTSTQIVKIFQRLSSTFTFPTGKNTFHWKYSRHRVLLIQLPLISSIGDGGGIKWIYPILQAYKKINTHDQSHFGLSTYV